MWRKRKDKEPRSVESGYKIWDTKNEEVKQSRFKSMPIKFSTLQIVGSSGLRIIKKGGLN